ncbi:MAG: transposase, partial [Candidatus Aenigmatarchaeota archaeon]
MGRQKLSTPVKLPEEHRESFERLEVLTRRVADQTLEKYWVEEHLIKVSEHEGRAWKYFDETEAFADIGIYLPSRFKRCILQKVGETLRSQAGKFKAFQAIERFLPERMVSQSDKKRIKRRIYESDEFVNFDVVDALLEQVNNYYREHGRHPDSYFDLQECPEYRKGTLPYSADDGPEKGQMVRYGRDDEFKVKIKLPETTSPEDKGDWGWFDVKPDVHEYFHRLAEIGELKAPEFHPKDRKTGERFYYLNFSVEVRG